MPLGRQQSLHRPRTVKGAVGRRTCQAARVPARPVFQEIPQRNRDESRASAAERANQQTKPKPPQVENEKIIPKEAWVRPPTLIQSQKVKIKKYETAEHLGRRRRVKEVKAKEQTHEEDLKPVQATKRVDPRKRLDVRSEEDGESAEKELPRGRRKGVLANKPGVHNRKVPKQIDEKHIKRSTTHLQHSPADHKEQTRQSGQQNIPIQTLTTPKGLPIPRKDIEKKNVLENTKKDIPTPWSPDNRDAINRELDAAYSKVGSLSKDDVMAKASFINNVVEKEVISKIAEMDYRFSFEILHAGSYYEKLKVGEADEFDIMVKLNANNISNIFDIKVCPKRRDSHLVGFAYLEYQSHFDGGAKWREFLVEGPDKRPVLSPQLILEQFKLLLTQRLRKMNSAKKRPWIQSFEPVLNGPAVKLTFRLRNGKTLDTDIVLCVEISQWPSVANNWGILHSSKWPSANTVTQIKSKGCHVVPKVHKSDNRCWRLSFSLAEKSLLSPRAIDEDKKYYKIVKSIFERHRSDLEPLCSYHLKTLLLHMRAIDHRISTQLNGIKVVEHFIQQLIQKLQDKELPHYFIGHNLNLFSEMSDRRALEIIDCLTRINLTERATIRELFKD